MISKVAARAVQHCPPCLVYLQQMLDLKVLLTLVFDSEKLSEEQISGVMNTISSFREGDS
ncbi:hypothetical protein [Mycobacterium gordonae]|uniref:hypothetical protein n=1 Tax=Mycobacterium gordonae TaxID=1778 RepID=UPI001560DF85